MANQALHDHVPILSTGSITFILGSSVKLVAKLYKPLHILHHLTGSMDG